MGQSPTHAHITHNHITQSVTNHNRIILIVLVVFFEVFFQVETFGTPCTFFLLNSTKKGAY